MGGAAVGSFMFIFSQLWRVTYGAVGAEQIGRLRYEDVLVFDAGRGS
ncbi:MAG: hypothetical protein R2911_39745 [Caldilineaceae bacterium]